MAEHDDTKTIAHPPEHPASWGGNPDQHHANEDDEKREDREAKTERDAKKKTPKKAE